jgi:glycine/D-amino acid oxidase-like deaminating enzyme
MPTNSFAANIAVIGGGLTGACIALELANAGKRVLLIEQDDVIMNRASLRNEGKIHLGLIYAADTTFKTAATQLHGALTFWPLLSKWLGDDVRRIGLSTPFDYLVARDSLMTADALEAHYQKLSDSCRAHLKDDPSLTYLGGRPDQLAYRIENSGAYGREKVSAVFRTAELAVSTDDLASVIRRTVDAHPLIDVLPNAHVTCVSSASYGVRIEGRKAGATITIEAGQAVNCAWEDRLRLDATYGAEPLPGWVYRLKYRLMARYPESLKGAPSATIVIGAYGDVVLRDDGVAYLSWYPTGCKGWSHELDPPKDWDAPCRAEPEPAIAAEVTANALENLAEWYPAIGAAKPLYVDAGAIVAYGKTDVDDPGSGLHDRTRIGVNAFDGGAYFSVDPGKLTTAPLFALEAANAIRGA